MRDFRRQRQDARATRVGGDDDHRLLGLLQLILPRREVLRPRTESRSVAGANGGHGGGEARAGRRLERSAREIGRHARGRRQNEHGHSRLARLGLENPVGRHRVRREDVADEEHRVGLLERLGPDEAAPGRIQAANERLVARRQRYRPLGADGPGESADGRQCVHVPVAVHDHRGRIGAAERLGYFGNGDTKVQDLAPAASVAMGVADAVRMVREFHQDAPAPAQARIARVRNVVGQPLVRPGTHDANRTPHVAEEAPRSRRLQTFARCARRHSDSP